MRNLLNITGRAIVLALFFVFNVQAQCSVELGADRYLCTGLVFLPDSAILQNTYTGSPGAASYQWTAKYDSTAASVVNARYFIDHDTVAVPVINSDSIAFEAADSVIFYLTVTDSAGNVCSDSVTIRFSKFNASTLADCMNMILEGDTVSLFAAGPTGGIPPISYVWTPNSDRISDTSMANPLVWPDVQTVYNVKVTDSVGCGYESSCTVLVVPSGLASSKQVRPAVIYPQPLTENSVLRLPAELSSSGMLLQVFNVYGQEVISQKVRNSEVQIGRWIDRSGIYFYKITDNVGQVLFAGKLIK